LELTSTRIRLEHEFDMLDETRRQLAARTVLRDTFSGSDSSYG
jgi:ATP-dependent Lon protease